MNTTNYLLRKYSPSYGFRVRLKDDPTLCGTTKKWAFLNKSDSNYETYVSLLTAAKFAKTEVTIHAIQTTDGFCRIGHTAIH